MSLSKILGLLNGCFREKPSEQALLTEYQVCQQQSDSSASSYWTLAAIFLGFSSVVLGGLLHEIITTTVRDACMLRIIVTGISVLMILMSLFLCFWLKRINDIAVKNFERMREIELDLEIMQKNWRVHAAACWTRLKIQSKEKLCDEQINEIWDKLKIELRKGLPEQYYEKLESRKRRLVEYCNNLPPQRWHERQSRDSYYKAILVILSLLWVFLIVMAWLFVI